jgi:hypothetical protein
MRPGERRITDKYGSRGRRLATIFLRSVITTISCLAWLLTLFPHFLRPSKISAIICVSDPRWGADARFTKAGKQVVHFILDNHFARVSRDDRRSLQILLYLRIS